MSRRGFTFIELMISASILAGVLITAFTVYAIINRNGRSAQKLRSDSYDGAVLVNLITEYGRHASPWLNENDQPVCTGGLTNAKKEALQYGLAREGTDNIWWFAVRESDQIGTTSGYLLYSFVFSNLGTVVTPLGTLNSYSPVFTSEKITERTPGSGSGICDSTAQTAALSLLPDNLRVVEGTTPQLITINKATTTSGGEFGSITLNVNQNRLPHFVKVDLGVVDPATPNQVPFLFQTAFTPRDYASEFIAL